MHKLCFAPTCAKMRIATSTESNIDKILSLNTMQTMKIVVVFVRIAELADWLSLSQMELEYGF